MIEGLEPNDEADGSAYDTGEPGLHRTLSASIAAFRSSNAMRSILGEDFVDLCCSLKEDEYMEFEEIITPWERGVLVMDV